MNCFNIEKKCSCKMLVMHFFIQTDEILMVDNFSTEFHFKYFEVSV